MNTKPNLTYSEVIYLFADKSVSERSRLVNYDNHPSGQKISVQPLSHKMVTAAIAYLAENNYLSLSVKNVKKLIFLSAREAFGQKIKDAGPEVTGIERKLLDNFASEVKVRQAVYHLLDNDESSPWGQIVRISKDSLVQKEFLFIEKERQNIFTAKRYLYTENKIREAAAWYEETSKILAEFTAKTDSYKLIEEAVKKGIAARKEQSSSDD